METLDDVHSKFKINMGNFLKLLEMILRHVKEGMDDDRVKLGEDANMIESILGVHEPSVIIGVMTLMMENADTHALLESFAGAYYKYWDELFSASCGLSFFQEKFSFLFEAAQMNSPPEISQNSVVIENENVSVKYVKDFMNEMLSLKDMEGNYFISGKYIERIIQYFRSFSKSSIKHLFVKREPFKRVKANFKREEPTSEEYYQYLFKNNKLFPSIDISKCIFFYNVDVSKLCDFK